MGAQESLEGERERGVVRKRYVCMCESGSVVVL